MSEPKQINDRRCCNCSNYEPGYCWFQDEKTDWDSWCNNWEPVNDYSDIDKDIAE